MLNVIEADSCWDAYLKSLKMLLDSKHLSARNVFMQINSTDDNYILSLPHVVDDLPWYLRVNSDMVEGELGVGVGLDVRYSQKRLGRVKGHGAYDWGYRDETGRPEPSPYLNLILEEDEIFPNIGRIGGNGQLHYVKDLLKLDPTSDKGIVQLWNWKRDLLEYTRRKYHSPRIVGEETWSDSQHQRIPCPVSWHFVVTPEGVENNVYSRSLVWNEHIHDDIFRFSEPSRWIGGNLGKPSGKLVMSINRLWTRDFEADGRARLTDLYDFWTSNAPVNTYYYPYHKDLNLNSEIFLKDWELKELAEQDYRLGAFYEGDKKLELISSPYYKDWVRVMRVAEMTIAHQVLGKMFRRGLHSRATKNALGYIEEKGLFNAVNEIEGVFKVQTVQWVVNYLLRSRYDTEDYKKYIELLPKEIQQLTLLSSLNRVKQPIVEEILPTIDKKYVKLSPEFRGEVVTTRLTQVKTYEEETDVRKPIHLEENPKFLVVDPYGCGRVNRKHPALIRELAEKKEINFCYFPVEPFHYREKKRHATENAMRACAESLIPISLETRSEVPEWAVDLLTRHKNSEIRIHLNTLDSKKWKLLFKNADEPEELMNSIIRCFNGGVYTILKIAPIVPGIITPFDVFKVVNATKNFVEKMEVCFANFSAEDFKKLEEKVSKKYAESLKFYEEVGGRYFVKEDYRKEFLRKLNGYTADLNIDLKIINEVSVADGDVVGHLVIGE